ncbi:hypothetical protein [Metabacillus sp. B2-18]|uniref:hypothetical protein n=1 Tax=Metabacillus sp. B2-18 TaxID=2897333 RepID=UPI001E4DEDBF|nr:hypothetical protein [Metabacillus sp. B2-18]UGB31719.1 hypothetical protein LPC09_04345 [Metabacillus sp. B2-18]
MKIRGTQDQVNNIEVNTDTVYIRSDIQRVETKEFNGWEYEEKQYNKDEYISQLTSNQDTEGVAFMLTLMMSEIDMLRMEIVALKGGV